jgi:hypothetical protein
MGGRLAEKTKEIYKEGSEEIERQQQNIVKLFTRTNIKNQA